MVKLGRVVLGAAAVLAVFATVAGGCSPESDEAGASKPIPDGEGGSGATTTTTSSGQGGAGTTTSTTGSGGSGGSTGPTCPHEGPPLFDPATFDACAPACGGAHCVPASLVPDDQEGQLAVCLTGKGGQGYCVPDLAIETGGNFIPKTCTSLAKAEGRCLSKCLPMVAEMAAILPDDVCGKDDLCVPCTDPTTGKDTGACTQSCDPGPQKPPVKLECPYEGPAIIDPKQFPACSPSCGGAHCVPASLIPADQASQLAPCSGGYCAPDSIIKSGGKSVPKTCTSIAGAEGRCVSTCLPAIADQAALLPQANCEADERCAPCFNPTAADPTAPTGACSLACDKPAQPPLVLTCPYTGPSVIDPAIFPACSPACGGAHCVPATLISDPSQASQLAACTSTNGAPGYCAPDFIVASSSNSAGSEKS